MQLITMMKAMNQRNLNKSKYAVCVGIDSSVFYNLLQILTFIVNVCYSYIGSREHLEEKEILW